MSNAKAEVVGPHSSSAPRPLGPSTSVPSNIALFKRLLEFVAPEKQKLATACLAMTLASMNNLAFPKIVAALIDSMAPGRAARAGSTKKFLLGALGMFTLAAVGSWLRTRLFQTATDAVARRLRKRLVQALMVQETSFFDSIKATDLAARISDDTLVAANAVTANLAKGFRYLNSALGGSVILFMLSPRLTLVSLSVVPMMGVSAMLYGMRARKLSKKLKAKIAEVTGFAEERMANFRTVRLFAMEEHEAKRYAELLEQTEPLVRQSANAEGVLMGGLLLGGFTSLIAVLYYGGTLVAKEKMTVGSLTSFAMYSATMGLGFSGLSQLHAETVKSMASAHRVFELIDRVPAVDQDVGSQLEKVEGEMELREVHFTYPSRPEVEVLRGLNLRLHKGEVLAVCGASGGGKSTIGGLLTRLYEPSTGQVLLDGVDVATLKASWLRSQIAVVNQEPVLFAESIRENIRYGIPSHGKPASDAEVEEAARQANAASFIAELPDKYETYVGERGLQLSGGQRQRVAIARAIIRDPRILVLDEATSALDNESERLVWEALQNLMKGRSTLMIAHRSSMIASASRIAVLDRGRVVQEGTFNELMEDQSGVFKQLMTTLGSR